MSDSDTKTLRVGLLAPVHELDPRGKQDFESTMILSHVFEPPLAQAEGEGDPEPLLLAERPAPDPDGDGTTFSAAVRDDVRFADGTPLSAEILADSLTRSKVFRDTADVEARDGRVIFRPKRPGSRIDLTLSQRYCGVVLERRGELLGTGPYRLDSASTPERTRLVQNPEYRHPVDIDAIEFVTYPPDEHGKPEALLEAVERGEVDFCNVVSREDIGRLKGVRKWLEPGSGTAILYFNTARPALKDPSVRRALALGIDRSEVAKICYPNPVAFTATGLVPPMMGSFRDGLSPDRKQAATLLKSAEGGPPERLTMLLIHAPRPYLPQPREIADNLAEQVGALGIDVEIRQAETLEDYFREATRGDYDLALSGWLADTADAADFLETILSPDSVPGASGRGLIDGNLSHWRSDAMKGALERYAADPNDEHKREIVDLLRKETPLLPLIYGPTIFVYSTQVMGFKPSPLGIPEFGKMKLVQ